MAEVVHKEMKKQQRRRDRVTKKTATVLMVNKLRKEMDRYPTLRDKGSLSSEAAEYDALRFMSMPVLAATYAYIDVVALDRGINRSLLQDRARDLTQRYVWRNITADEIDIMNARFMATIVRYMDYVRRWRENRDDKGGAGNESPLQE